MRILLLEDEEKTVAFLAKGLREGGFKVNAARDGETGLKLACAAKFDLLIVDVMLPKIDGWEVVADLRRRGIRTPILFLTARDSVRDRVKGLELGADDYLVKPSHFPNCSPGFARCCGALLIDRQNACALMIWKSTCDDTRRFAPACRLISRRRNFSF